MIAISPLCLAIFASSSPGVNTPSLNSSAKRANSGSADLPAPLKRIGFMRSLRVLNSSRSNSGLVRFSSTPDQASASILRSKGTSATSCVSSRFRMTLSIESRRDCPTLPPTLSTFDKSSCSDPYSTTHFAAVFSPTPGIDGKLSLGSPRRAAKSGYCAGDIPYFSCTASGVIRAKSLTPRFG